MVFIDFVDKHVWGFVEESVLGSSKNEVMSQYIDFAFDERLPDGSYPSFDQASKPYPALSLVLHAKEQGGWIFTEHDDVILLDGDANSVFSEIAGQDFLEMASLGHHTKDACKQMIDGADINFIVPPPEWMFSDLRNKSGFLQMARIQISNLGLLGDVDAQCFEERLDEILKEELTEKVRQHSACVDGKCLIRGKCH